MCALGGTKSALSVILFSAMSDLISWICCARDGSQAGESSTSVTMSHKLSAGIRSDLRPASHERFSASVLPCETRFLLLASPAYRYECAASKYAASRGCGVSQVTCKGGVLAKTLSAIWRSASHMTMLSSPIPSLAKQNTDHENVKPADAKCEKSMSRRFVNTHRQISNRFWSFLEELKIIKTRCGDMV